MLDDDEAKLQLIGKQKKAIPIKGHILPSKEGIPKFPCSKIQATKTNKTIPNAFFFMFFTSCFLDFLLGGIGNAARHEPPCASDKRKWCPFLKGLVHWVNLTDVCDRWLGHSTKIARQDGLQLIELETYFIGFLLVMSVNLAPSVSKKRFLTGLDNIHLSPCKKVNLGAFDSCKSRCKSAISSVKVGSWWQFQSPLNCRQSQFVTSSHLLSDSTIKAKIGIQGQKKASGLYEAVSGCRPA